MAKDLTTLVLGAGVSMDYGFPSGATLIEQIIKNVSARQMSGLENQFVQYLKDDPAKSIDAFLKSFQQFDVIGKGAIAEILYRLEDPDVSRSNPDFYTYLSREIPIERFSEFKIVSFNYDRSLEFFWARALSPGCGGLAAAYQALSKLEIHHIHGRLSGLPEEKRADVLTRDGVHLEYGECNGHGSPRIRSLSPISYVSRQELLDAQAEEMRKAIRIYGNETFKTAYQNNDRHEAAYAALRASSRIFFLGFSYHPLNMKLLGLDWSETATGKTIVGTCFGMTPMEIETVSQDYPAVRLYEKKALSLFDDHYSLGRAEIQRP